MSGATPERFKPPPSSSPRVLWLIAAPSCVTPSTVPAPFFTTTWVAGPMSLYPASPWQDVSNTALPPDADIGDTDRTLSEADNKPSRTWVTVVVVVVAAVVTCPCPQAVRASAGAASATRA